MGVPKFFRWLTERFPQINRRISEGRSVDEWVDNFYLDMNGIIHTCTHGDGIKPGEVLDEEETTRRIFEYTERLIRIAKPRKVCYLAIDGVAPRAKMNQQRSRRYRAPREAAQLLAQQERQGIAPPEEPPFDSNCITPGTEFLCDLGEKYKEWIAMKLETDPAWKNGPTIIFSGSEVIGEGEHKIMDFIRRGRDSGEFDDETRHCMYGLDADLIMLGLVTHAPKFCLLRERQRFQKGRLAPRKRGGRGAPRPAPTGITDAADLSRAEEDNRDFIFLEVEMLRYLLAGTLRPRASSFAAMPSPTERNDAAATASLEAADAANEALFDDERLVDDFVFMCMLVGNDFLPGLPHLDVADGALNLMLRTYTQMLPSNGYLTDKRTLNMAAFERFVGALSTTEPAVFEKKRMRANSPMGRGGGRGAGRFQRNRGYGGEGGASLVDDPLAYKREYYLAKLGLHPKDGESRRALVTSYLEGLCWCLAYYHDGCASWDWYFPDFYAPLASELTELESHEISLELGRPFPPLAQLLSVLPPQSAQLVPPGYRDLMLSPTSPVFDAYPTDFALDLNGKRAEWEAVAMLPFIDEQRLLTVVEAIDASGGLTDAERVRNQLGYDLYYMPEGSDYKPAELPEEQRVGAAALKFLSP
jgi:5'-3' exoribonuclease 1